MSRLQKPAGIAAAVRRRRCRLRGFSYGMLWALSLVGMAPLNDAVAIGGEPSQAGSLYIVSWRGGFLFQHWHGTACWLRGPEGALRAEIALTTGPAPRDDNSLQAMLLREGQGWTLAVAGPTAGTVNSWGRRWREADLRLVAGLQVLSHLVEDGPLLAASSLEDRARLLAPVGERLSRPKWQTANGSGKMNNVLRLELIPVHPRASHPAVAAAKPISHASTFRRLMSHRGLGRGDEAEILTARWETAGTPIPGASMTVKSSRRIFRLNVSAPRTIAVQFPYPESFLPIWSLADLIELSAGP